jgi:hypothetical protein
VKVEEIEPGEDEYESFEKIQDFVKTYPAVMTFLPTPQVLHQLILKAT